MRAVISCQVWAMPAIVFSECDVRPLTPSPMASSETLLIVADSEHDANMLYAVGVFVPDPFIYLRIRRRNYVVVSDLEIDRVKQWAPHCHALPLGKYLQKLRKDGVKNPGFAQVIPMLLKQHGIRHVTVPHNFPHGLAADLAKAKIRVKPRPG